MNLSKFVIELFELSGMSEDDFCQKLKINKAQFSDIKAGSDETSASVKTLVKAFAATLFSKPIKIDPEQALKNDKIDKKLTQAHAIIVTVGESEHLADHHQTSLSVAADLVENARQKV